MLACKELGYPAVGIDILPVAVYVASIKLQDWLDTDELAEAVDTLMNLPFHEPKERFPDVKIVDLAFSTEVKKKYCYIPH
ncbi:hypothetical protein JXM67_11020 [candidate division WOR-3 bacterium]|nr:hypothetical protein [candidate division WOR-3 bacterium]